MLAVLTQAGEIAPLVIHVCQRGIPRQCHGAGALGPELATGPLTAAHSWPDCTKVQHSHPLRPPCRRGRWAVKDPGSMGLGEPGRRLPDPQRPAGRGAAEVAWTGNRVPGAFSAAARSRLLAGRNHGPTSMLLSPTPGPGTVLPYTPRRGWAERRSAPQRGFRKSRSEAAGPTGGWAPQEAATPLHGPALTQRPNCDHAFQRFAAGESRGRGLSARSLDCWRDCSVKATPSDHGATCPARFSTQLQAEGPGAPSLARPPFPSVAVGTGLRAEGEPEKPGRAAAWAIPEELSGALTEPPVLPNRVQ